MLPPNIQTRNLGILRQPPETGASVKSCADYPTLEKLSSYKVPPSYVCCFIIYLRIMLTWLVVLTILKNISQWEGLSHMLENKTCLKPPTSLGKL